MPLSSFVYPDFFPAEDSNERIQAAHIDDTEHSFFNILTKLINSNGPFLLNKTSDHNNSVLFDLKEIWENNGKPMSFEHIQNEYQYIFNEYDSYHINLLISIIVAARFQYLQTYIKNSIPTEENQLQFIKETQQRINFMIQITNLFSKKLFISKIKNSFHCFLLNIFNDMLSITTNISKGLFDEVFPNHNKDLMKRFEQVTSIIEIFAKTTLERLSKKNKTNFDFLKSSILKILTKSTIEYIRYYFAIGEDEQALLLLEKCNQKKCEDNGNDTEKKIFIKEIKKIAPAKKALITAVKENVKRNFYAKILKSFKKIGLIGSSDLEPKTQEAYTKAITNNTLVKTLENMLAEIKYLNEKEKSLDSIPQSIMFIGLIAQQDYYNNSEVGKQCQLIFETAEKIIKNILNKDESSIIAIKIRECLSSYAEKMHFFKPSSDLVFPDLFLLPKAQNDHRGTFFTILCNLISLEDGFYEKIKHGLKINIDKIWVNNATTFTKEQEITILINLCSKEESLKTLMSIILQARNHIIDIHKKTDLSTEEEQFEYFKETTQRFNFMFCIANIIDAQIDARDLQKEAFYFLISICSDAITNAKNISKGLFLERFKKYPSDLSMHCQSAIFMVTQVIKIFHTKEWISTNPYHMSDVKTQIIDWPLFYAQYHSAIGDRETAIQYLEESTEMSEYEGRQQQRELLKAKHEKFLKQKEELYTHIQNDYKRKTYSEILAYFYEQGIAIQEPLQGSVHNVEKQLNLVSEVCSNSIPAIKQGFIALRVMQKQNYNNDLNLFNLSQKILAHLFNLFSYKKNPGNCIVLRIESHLETHQKEMNFQPVSNIDILKEKNAQLNEEYVQSLSEQEQQNKPILKEIETLKNNLPNLNEKIEKVQKQIEDNVSNIKPLEKEIASLEQEEITINLELENTEKTVQALQTETIELEKKLRALSQASKKDQNTQVKKSKEKLEHAKQQLIANTEKLTTVTKEIAVTHSSIVTIDKNTDAFVKEMDANIENIEAELILLQEKMNKLETQNTKFTDIVENAKEMHHSIHQNIESIEKAQTKFFKKQNKDIQGFLNILNKLTDYATLTCSSIQPVSPVTESVNTKDEVKNYRRSSTP